VSCSISGPKKRRLSPACPERALPIRHARFSGRETSGPMAPLVSRWFLSECAFPSPAGGGSFHVEALRGRTGVGNTGALVSTILCPRPSVGAADKPVGSAWLRPNSPPLWRNPERCGYSSAGQRVAWKRNSGTGFRASPPNGAAQRPCRNSSGGQAGSLAVAPILKLPLRKRPPKSIK
jgi:hypothetical protein